MTLRSILAVTAGGAVFGIAAVLLFSVSGLDPHGSPPPARFMIGILLYGALFALAGGYVAASVARGNEVRHGLALMVLIAIAAIISFTIELGYGATWMEIATMFLISPFAIAGGALRRRFAVK